MPAIDVGRQVHADRLAVLGGDVAYENARRPRGQERLADARQRCEQLRTAIATITTDAGNSGSSVSASFGVSATSTSGYELRHLLAHADAALYRAKYAGRNCVVLYDTMHAVGIKLSQVKA